MLITKRLLVEIIIQELNEVFGTAYGSFPKRDEKKKKGSFKFDPNSTKNQGRWRLKNPDEFAEELLLKYKKDFLFIVDGLSRGGDVEVVLSKDYKDLKKGTRITLENVKDFSEKEFFNMTIEDKFKGYDPFFLKN